MNWWQKSLTAFRSLFRKEELDADMAEELHSHIEMHTRENMDAGMKPQEARRVARLQFGAMECIQEVCREERGTLFFEQLLQDLRYGLRALRKSPGFTAVAVATLALGIGVNTAIFSIISAVLLLPLPYPKSEELVQLDQSNRKDAVLSEYGVSVPNYRDWRAMSHSFAHLGIHFYDDFWLTEGEQVRPVRARYFSAEMLPALGVKPLLGRGFSEEDEKAEGVAVVGYDLWQHVLGSQTNLADATIIVNNRRLQVVGVMPPGFNFPSRMELWLPLPDSKKEFQNRGWTLGGVTGRLKPGVSVAQAQAEMDAIARQLEAQYPENKEWGIRVTSLHDKAIASIRPALPILGGVALFVLLIACANLGNLLLSRSLARQKELAIRAAVGAGNGRLIRQLLTESLLLSLVGAAAGFLAVLWTRSLWSGLVGPHLPRFAVIRIDFNVWWYTLGVAVLTGLGCGLIPAWRIWRTDLQETLKEGGQRSAAERPGGWVRSGLVVGQVSLALVLLIGAGLALRSVYHLLHPGLSVDPNKVLVVNVQLPKASYPEDVQRLQLFEQLKERMRAWPTVETSGAASFIAFGSGMQSPMSLKDRPNDPPRWTFSCDVSPDFFRTIGVPLLAVVGTALGLLLAWACTRLMTSLIEGISPRDAITFVVVPWVLLAFAFLGCYLPARKAARVDPLAALRYE